MKKNVKILFTLSVILNVVLLGAAGGMAYKKWQDNPWQMAKEEMSPESKEMLQQTFGEMHKDMQPLFAEMKKNRNEMRALLLQQNFDAVRFDLVTQNYRKLRREMSEKMSDVTKQVASKLPAQDRQKMADQFVRGFGWKYSSGGHKGDCDYGRAFGPPPKEDRY